MLFLNTDASTIATVNLPVTLEQLTGVYSNLYDFCRESKISINIEKVITTLQLRHIKTSNVVKYSDRYFNPVEAPEIAMLEITSGDREGEMLFSFVAGNADQLNILELATDKEDILISSTPAIYAAYKVYAIASNPTILFTEDWHFGQTICGKDALENFLDKPLLSFCGALLEYDGTKLVISPGNQEGMSDFKLFDKLSNAFEFHNKTHDINYGSWIKRPKQLISILKNMNNKFGFNIDESLTKECVFYQLKNILQAFYQIEEDWQRRIFANMYMYELLQISES